MRVLSASSTELTAYAELSFSAIQCFVNCRFLNIPRLSFDWRSARKMSPKSHGINSQDVAASLSKSWIPLQSDPVSLFATSFRRSKDTIPQIRLYDIFFFRGLRTKCTFLISWSSVVALLVRQHFNVTHDHRLMDLLGNRCQYSAATGSAFCRSLSSGVDREELAFSASFCLPTFRCGHRSRYT